MITGQKTLEDEILTAAYRDYARRLNSYAYGKVHDRDVSRDLVQDTFMKTWLYLIKKGEIGMMKAFLYRILNNLIVDTYRKHTTTSLDALIENGFAPKTDSSEQLINFLDGKRASQYIKQLPEKYRSVVDMRYAQGLSLAQMSLITGQTKNTIAVQLHRGLAMLKQAYKEHRF